MKRWLLRSAAVAAVLMFAASAAFAAGSLNMSWTNCTGEGTPVTNKTFACAANTGTNLLVCSFVAPANLHQFAAAELFVDLISQSTPLPAWWAIYAMGNGGTQCRSALSVNFVQNASDVVCLDAWAAAGVGGIAAYANPIVALPTIDGSNSAQYATIDLAAAVPTGQEQDLTAGSEYFLANIAISNTKSTGAGSCAGCADPVCISFTRAVVQQPTGVGDFYISTPGVNSLVTWQGTGANCTAVPVKKATWGSIKSMYR
jgi:hypothetical protein